MTDDRLRDRLRSAYRIEMGDETRRRQLAAIAATLQEGPDVVPAAAPWRRRLAALVAAATALGPAAVAVAAEGSLPGDLLYPVKRVTEDLRAVVDPTVVARHRLDEVERLAERGDPAADLSVLLDEADRAIDDTGDPPELRDRWRAVAERLGHGPSIDAPPGGSSPQDVPRTGDEGTIDHPPNDGVVDHDEPGGGATDHDGPAAGKTDPMEGDDGPGGTGGPRDHDGGDRDGGDHHD